MSPEDMVLEVRRRSGEEITLPDRVPAHEIEAASSGGGELFWIVVLSLWGVVSIFNLLGAGRQGRRDPAWFWAASYAAASLLAALLFARVV